MKSLKLGIIFFLVAGQALAQWRHDNYFELSKVSTPDSQVIVSSKTDINKDVKWIWIQVSNGNKKTDNFFESYGGKFSALIWLRQGAGEYTLKIMSSKNEKKFGSYAIEEQYTVENTDEREVENIAPTSEIQSDSSDIIDLAESITYNLPTNLEKTRAIHDWVATNIAYDIDAFMEGTYVQKGWDALSLLETRKAVCQGYANLTAALNRAVGIPARLVTGEALPFGVTQWTGRSNHAWNEVLIDGRWVIQDTTWDAGYVDFLSRKFTPSLRQKYFDPTPEEFAKDHRAE